MGTPAEARFYLINPVNGQYYYKSGNAVLQSVEPRHLVNVPDGWQGMEVNYKRNPKYHGLFTGVTDDYSFVGDGAYILRYLIYTFGLSAKCQLRIMLLDYNTWLHTDEFYVGDIDFEKLDDQWTKLSAGALEPGIAADLRNSSGTDFEIPIENDAVPVSIYKGTKLKGQYNYVFGKDTIVEVPCNVTSGFPPDNGRLFNLLMINTVNEGSLPVAISKTANPVPGMGTRDNNFLVGLTTDWHPYEENVFEVKQETVKMFVTLKAKIKWDTVNIPSGVNMRFGYYLYVAKMNEESSVQTTIYLSASTHSSTGVDSTYTEEININGLEISYASGSLHTNDRIYVMPCIETDVPVDPGEFALFNVGLDPSSENNQLMLEVHFNTPSEYQDDPSDPDNTFTDLFGYRPIQMLEKLSNKIGDGKYGASILYRSDFLSNPNTRRAGSYPYRVVMTTGDMIRRVPNAAYKCSYDDVYKFLFSTYAVGCGVVNNQIRIEDLSFFYDRTTKIADLGEVSNLKFSLMTEGRGTSVRIGPKYDEANKLNGKDEFNTPQTYKQPVTVDKSTEVDLTHNVNVSMYSIEDLRLNMYYQTTTSSSNDNSLFAISITNDRIAGPDTAYKVFYPEDNGGAVEGVYFPETAYNVDLSPGRDRERLKPYLSSLLYPITAPMAFQTAERNDHMRSRFSVLEPFVNERADMVPDVSAILFMPIIAQFDAPKSFNVRALIQNNPYGYVEFTDPHDGTVYKGFIKEVTVQPIDRADFHWSVLLTPDNNLSQFIR